MEARQNRILLFTAGICMGVILAAIVGFQPFWGLMDDPTIFNFLQKARLNGFWQEWFRFVQYDLFVSGRLRPFFPVMMQVLYGPFSESTAVYFANGIFVFSIFYALAVVLRKHFFAEEANNKSLSILFFVLCFIYPWAHYFFMAPALQEKLVLLALILFLALFLKLKNTSNLIVYTIAVAALLIVGIATKEQFAIFFPLFLILQISKDAKDKRFYRSFLLLFLEVLAVFVVWKIGKIGGYKNRYGWDSAILTFRQSKSLYLFFTFILLHITVLFVYLRPRNLQQFLQKIYCFAPSVCLLAFLVIMIPWGMGGYLNAVTTPLVALGIVQIFTLLKRKLPFTVAISILAVGITLYQSVVAFSNYGDLRSLLFSEELKQYSPKKMPIYMPCEEGAGAVAQYAEKFAGISLHVKAVLFAQDFEKLRKQNTLWIVSSLRCYPDYFSFLEAIKNGQAEVLREPINKYGFYLLMLSP